MVIPPANRLCIGSRVTSNCTATLDRLGDRLAERPIANHDSRGNSMSPDRVALLPLHTNDKQVTDAGVDTSIFSPGNTREVNCRLGNLRTRPSTSRFKDFLRPPTAGPQSGRPIETRAIRELRRELSLNTSEAQHTLLKATSCSTMPFM